MTTAERAKLARILGMLGSEHAGERASAALQAEAFRKRHGLTWAGLLALPPVEMAEVEPEPEPQAEPAAAPTAQQSEQAKWDARPAWYREMYPGWAPIRF